MAILYFSVCSLIDKITWRVKITFPREIKKNTQLIDLTLEEEMAEELATFSRFLLAANKKVNLISVKSSHDLL